MTQTTNTPTLHDRISNQREAVQIAYISWQCALPQYEEVAWETYQAECQKLNALYKQAKIDEVTA